MTSALAGLGYQALVLMLCATVVFAAVAILVRCFRRASPGLLYALWGLVLLRLVLPPDLAAPWSLASLGARMSESLSTLTDGAPAPAAPEPATAAHPPWRALAPAAGDAGTAMALFAGAWIATAVCFACYLRYRRRRYVRLLAGAEPVCSPVADCLLQRWRANLGIRRPVRLVTGEARVEPFTAGTLRPRVFVPRSVLRRPRLLEAALAHELAHVRRLDDLRLLLHSLVGVLYPLFPPVHFAVARMDAERERLCDQLVVSSGRLSRRRYAEALLSMLRTDLAPAAAVPGLSNPRRSIKMRFQSLLRDRHPRPAWADRLVHLTLVLVLLPMAPAATAGASGEADPSAAAAEPAAFLNPLPGEAVTSSFGERRNPFGGDVVHHDGIDVHASESSRVVAPADGVVEMASRRWADNEHMGLVMLIDHGEGLKTYYAHLDAFLAEEGQRVMSGQEIAVPGTSGKTTGPHLHFEIWRGEEKLDPADYVADWRGGEIAEP